MAPTAGQRMDAVGIFLTCLMYLVFATSFIAAKYGLVGLTPFALGVIRTALAAAVLFAICLWRNYAFPRQPWRWLEAGLLGFLTAGAPATVAMWGVQHTQASLATVIMATQPFMVAALAHHLLPNDRLTGRKLAWLVAGFVGVALISLDKTGGAGDQGSLAGQGAMFVNAIAIAFSAVLAKSLSRHWQVLPFTAVQTAGGFFLAALAAVAFDRGAVLQFSPLNLAATIYLALGPTLLGYVLWVHLLARHRASAVSAFSFTQPGFGILLGWLLLGEPFGWLTPVGVALIAWSIVSVNRSL